MKRHVQRASERYIQLRDLWSHVCRECGDAYILSIYTAKMINPDTYEIETVPTIDRVCSCGIYREQFWNEGGK